MFDVNDLDELFDENPVANSLDPTPDTPLTALDWLEIGFDRLIIPLLGGMFVPVISRILPVSALMILTIGTFLIPGFVVMSYLSGPANKFKWVFTLLTYLLGIIAGCWDLLLRMSLASTITATLVIFGSTCVALATCLFIRSVIRG